MTVEEYLRSLVIGLEIPDTVLKRAAMSPKEVGLKPLNLDDDVEDYDGKRFGQARLDYAASTIYYSVLGVFSGGGYSEQVGDVSLRKNDYIITMADRERFKMLADALRRKWGFETEDDIMQTGGMFDADYLRHRRI